MLLPAVVCEEWNYLQVLSDQSLYCVSPFTFHLGFVHPPQDVAFHQGLPLSSVAFLFHVVPSFLVMSSCHLLLGRPMTIQYYSGEGGGRGGGGQSGCIIIEGSRPERCISSMIHSRDEPFWSETLNMIVKRACNITVIQYNTSYCTVYNNKRSCERS